MAKGVYDKKRPTVKKVSNFDMKVVIIVAVILAVVVAGIIVAAVIAGNAGSYIGKVNGMRISKFDYTMMLSSVKLNMEDGVEDVSAFWTDEKKKEAEDKALEEIKKVYILFDLAKKNGDELSKDEKDKLFNYVANLASYASKSIKGLSNIDDATGYVLSDANYFGYGYAASVKYEEIREFVNYYAKLQAASDYQNNHGSDLMESYKLDDLYFKDPDTKEIKSTGEAAILDEYEANRDSYRRINLQALAISKTTSEKPTAPTVVTEPTAPETEDKESEEYKNYEKKLEDYNKYLEEKAKYDSDLEEYYAGLRTKVTAIYNALVEGGKYTGKGIKELDTGDKDEEGKAIKAVSDYEDASLEDLIKKEGEKYASTMDQEGKNQFYGTPSKTNLLAVFAQSLEWKDDTHTAVKSMLVERWAEAAVTEEPKAEEEPSESEEPADDDQTADAGDTAETGETGETGDTAETGDETAEEPDVDPWAEYKNDYVLDTLVENGAFKETKLKLFEDDNYFYIVKCTGIEDIETSTEEETEETEILSVRAYVINVLKYYKATDTMNDDLDALMEKTDISGKKSDVIAKVSKRVFAAK